MTTTGNPTFIIGLDGATFTVLDHLMHDGTMPFLRTLVEGGVRAPLLSTANPLTPPAWTSLMTGRTPGHHGVFDFARVVRQEGIPRSRLSTSRDVAVETIWAIASRHGRRVTTLNFPLTYPPRPINGSLVPGFVRWRHLKRSLWPTDLYESLARLPGFNVKELALDWELERKALQALPAGEYEGWIRFHIRRERQWMEIIRWLFDNRPADLFAIMFDGTDKLQHLCWRFIDPACRQERPDAWETMVGGLILDYFRQLDGFIEEIVGRAGEGSRVFLASDHGFGQTTEIFYPNVWLQREGYLTWDATVGVVGNDQLNIDGHRDPSSLFDWDRTTACTLTAGGSGIFIRQAAGTGRPGVPAAEYESFRRRLVERLREAKDDRGRPYLEKVMTREEAWPGPHNDRAPDILLVLRDGGSISVLNSGTVLKPREEVSGAHREAGIFIAHGTGIRRGTTIPALQIADVAAAALHSLGLAIPSDFEGNLPVAAYTGEFLSARPAVVGDPTQPPEPFPGQTGGGTEAQAEEQEEQAVLDRLKALGYIE
jgi:predicted AlkP superfamily phosphohydrolase/phosphomutase